MYKRSLTICALMSLVLCGNKAIAQDYSNLEDIYNEPIYSLKDSANDANTTLSVKLYTLGDNGRISEEITKYVNINKTTTEKDGTTYDLTYNWDDNTKKLSVSPSGLQIKNNGDYIGNSAGWGSAVAITTDTDLVEGNIIGNWTTNIGGQVTVKNGARLEKIDANFIANAGRTNGGAINNDGSTIGTVDGVYLANNTVQSEGGAIRNTGGSKIENVTGIYIANHANGSGGAINNNGSSCSIDNIDGIYIGNIANNSGGAIYNYYGKIGKISGLYMGNYGGNSYATASGGAILSLYGTIENINADFIGNYVVSSGRASAGAIDNNTSTKITNGITGNFIGNYAKSTGTSALARGGAVLNFGEITGGLVGNFYDNYAESAGTGSIGGVVANMLGSGTTGVIDFISGDFDKNYALATGSGYSYGGVIYNINEIGEIKNSNFTDNFAKSETGEAKGGAIYSTKDLNIVAENGTSIFEGNYTQKGEETDDNAIYLDSATATLKLEQKSDGKMYMYDNIRGADGYKTRIEGDGTGTYYMFNDIHNGDVTFANTMVNTVNNDIHVYNFKKLTVEQDTDFVADVDLANEEMDRFTADSYGEHQGNLNVVGMNMLSDTTKDDVAIYFAQEGLMNNVVNKIDEIPTTKWQTKAYTPIYKYNVDYIKKTDKFDETKQAGYFVFTKGDKILEDVIIDPEEHTVTPVVRPTHRPHEAFNPAVLSSNVVTQAGGNAAMNEALRFAFEHGDTFMNFSSMDRFAKINDNAYALSTDYNGNLNYSDLSHENKSVWVKPYSVFESIDLKNGPKVDTISYGTLVGFDSNIHRMKKGWYNVGTAYIGYNGSQIDYKGVDASMNGGLLGLTETFYKGNFWTAITATAGAGVAEAHTMYGKDDMTMLMAGIGSKTGYNFEFADGKFIIQPRMFISYSMINTFDYTNAAGVRIDSDPMHTIQLNPAIKFIGNTKNGWQPYASVGMMWNLLNETETTANGVKLPEMHTKPYVEYGVGIQKLWNDKYSAYGQAMVRNGGRTGVALTLGFRMALGNDGKPIERTQKDKQILKQVQNDNSKQILNRVQNDSAERKVLKQLSPTQKAHLMQTTRTSMVGIVK